MVCKHWKRQLAECMESTVWSKYIPVQRVIVCAMLWHLGGRPICCHWLRGQESHSVWSHLLRIQSFTGRGGDGTGRGFSAETFIPDQFNYISQGAHPTEPPPSLEDCLVWPWLGCWNLTWTHFNKRGLLGWPKWQILIGRGRFVHPD